MVDLAESSHPLPARIKSGTPNNQPSTCSSLAFPRLGRRQGLGEESVEQVAAGVVASGEARLQPVAQRHQRIDLADDAVLFGKGWEGKGQSAKLR